jgi:hypothetical protein
MNSVLKHEEDNLCNKCCNSNEFHLQLNFISEKNNKFYIKLYLNAISEWKEMKFACKFDKCCIQLLDLECDNNIHLYKMINFEFDCKHFCNNIILSKHV